ncbi:effector protein B, substrate of the Dot/Icm secretion system [Marinomonas sp. MED121]|uniref:hypothetical protein n=1 Tax=Marinomonas sp. MED121 TaxID=314277 RepID=UPI0000690539|nr:hypothetical protein [Marinomonas sp. MED121]EAQ63353.1 effector protein B, substrate of the Dot/Icm secretion system [Marinomonas sp. MED121]
MKLLVWTLIEITTLFIFLGGIFIWLKLKLKKDEAEDKDEASSDQEDSQDTSDKSANNKEYEEPSLLLKTIIQGQLKQAAQQLTKTKVKEQKDKVFLIKLWGTLLKAENKVLDHPTKKDTNEIIQQELSSVLNNIFNAKKDNSSLKDLEEKLSKLTQSADKSNEVLKLKNDLETAQSAIKEELTNQIENLQEAAKRIESKQREKINLEQKLSQAMTNLKQLKDSLVHLEDDNDISHLITGAENESIDEMRQDLGQHKANKQIKSLNQVANRQQAVIDMLREKLRDTNQADSDNDTDNSQAIAIGRIEQMIKESDTLILQLENELGTTNLTIENLKSDIKQKSNKLLETEETLILAQKTALTSFKETTKNQQSKVDDMKTHMSNVPENESLKAMIEEQQKESDTLERLLKESETCVTLLEQELATAKKNNEELQHTIETVNTNFTEGSSTSTNNEFQQLEIKNKELLSEHSKVKQKLLASIANDVETELRDEYNQKNLEVDRLQLAIIDLEKKQIESMSAPSKD